MCMGALLLLPAAAAYADNGPHGAYTKTSDKCAACHRAHTASGSYLLTQSTETALCLSCHGTSGQGALTNVEDGIQNSNGLALLGGGFTNAVMNSAATDTWTPASLPVTSAHTLETSTTVWGNGAISATSDPGLGDYVLECTSCHDPHGMAGTGITTATMPTYRILRTFPTGVSYPESGTGTVVPDPAVKTYTLQGDNADAGEYWAQHYNTATNNIMRWEYINSWCSQCHTRHASLATGATTDSGDAIYAYRHGTNPSATDTYAKRCQRCHGPDGFVGDATTGDPADRANPGSGAVSCLACHVAHGSSANMTGFATTVPYPGGASGNEDSSLLRLDSRGVCAGCHPYPD
jgi:predicted CXXCH cytochrome family protein